MAGFSVAAGFRGHIRRQMNLQPLDFTRMQCATDLNSACRNIRLDAICSPLKCELERNLHESWRSRPHYMAEKIAVNVAIDSRWSEKLRVIESVEGFQTELQRFCFRQLERSKQGKIGVEHSWSVE